MITIPRAVGLLGPVDDEQELGRLIEGATAQLSREFLRYLGPILQRVEIKNGDGCSIWLNDEPAPDTGISIRTREGLFEVWEAAPAEVDGEIQWVLDGMRIEHRSGWPWGRSTVEVTYAAGHPTGEGPIHLQDLVLAMVASRWASRAVEAGEAGKKSETIGDYSYTNFTAAELAGIAGGLGFEWKDYVNRWRRRLI